MTDAGWKSPWRRVLVHVTFELYGLIGRETIEVRPMFPREDPTHLLFRVGICFGSHLTKKQGQLVRILRVKMEQP